MNIAENRLLRNRFNVKPSRYQPNKAELEKDARIKTTPEDLARRALAPTKILEDFNA